ncbi:MAG: radical SAM protein, partial [Deltaproteobacteria bacterium]|nr:radical SAM protein [Deltaproteobacteria bacterium]
MPENPESPTSGRRHPMSGPRPFIIPIFLPHAGCPHQCAFCNQSAITGVKPSLFSPEKLCERINEFLCLKGKQRRPIQIAFYGGNFLGQKESYLSSLLKAATKFVTAGKIDSIRISTRPDTILNDRLDILEPYPVSTIELGVQSMD